MSATKTKSKRKAGSKSKAATAKAESPKATSTTKTKKAKPRRAGDEQKPKRVSALDAAAQVLATSGKPMKAQELITAMAEQGLWSSPAGKTPHATLYAALGREIAKMGDAARFKKVDRGLFAAND